MRILAVTTFFPNSSDPQRAVFVKNLLQAMRAHSSVQVVAPLPFAPPLRGVTRWHQRSAIPAREAIDGFDVEHPRYLVIPKLEAFTGLNYYLGIATTLGRIVDAARPDLLHAHCAYPDAVGVALAARRLRLPFAVTVHGSDINVYAQRHLLRTQIGWALRSASGVIAVSGDLRSKVEPLLRGSGAQLAHIPCAGFDPQTFRPRSRQDLRSSLGLPAAARVAAFVGELVPIKGLEILVDAWALLTRRRRLGDRDCLVLIGAGRCQGSLQQQAQRAGVGARIRFIGAIPQPEVARWVGAADLLCLPSRNEGTPNVVVEALASGVPVVASRVGGIPELVRDGDNGELVAPGDAASLADALERALNRSWDAVTISRSVAHMTWQALAQRNRNFLESVLESAACEGAHASAA